MAYQAKKFDYAAFLSPNKDKLNQLQNQINNYEQNFNSTYDHTKDAGWVAANDQLMSAADVASSNARGRLANRIGATSTAQQVASDSVYADALKNSQNLIPQYRGAAYDKGYNNLQNQYNMLLQQDQYDYQKYLNDRNLAYDQYNTVENNNLQAYLAEQNRLAAQAQAEADKLKAQLDNEYKYNQLIAQYGTDWLKDAAAYLDGGTGSAGSGSGSTGVSGSKSVYGPPTFDEWKNNITGGWTPMTNSSSDAVNDFLNNIYDRSTFNRNLAGQSGYSDYNSYVERMIGDWIRAGRLTQSDANRIRAYYK